jgi:hypothetical protein
VQKTFAQRKLKLTDRKKENTMKPILTLLSILFLMLSTISVADAAVCGSNYRGAGCVGPNGAIVKRHGYGRPIVVVPNNHHHYHRHYRHRPRCAWVHGRKVCR